jgi:PAS domain S-box-containing protein
MLDFLKNLFRKRFPRDPTDRDVAQEKLRFIEERNVAAQRQAQFTLRESEARKTAMLETALDAIITIDQEGKIIEFNPAAEKTFGYSRDDVLGRQIVDLIIPPSLRARHVQGLAHYLATGEGPVLNKRIEMPALHADGSEFWVELAITRIDAAGPALFTAYIRDITERKWTERPARCHPNPGSVVDAGGRCARHLAGSL